MEILLLIAALVVLVGGLGVLVVSRRGESAPGIEPGIDTGIEPPAPTLGDPVTADVDPVAETGTEPPTAPVDEPSPEPVAEKPTFRDRLSKARSTFSGYVGSLLSRSDITDETWDELEEALIRADVGVALTTVLLDELRSTVKEEGITEPAVLVEALKAQLKSKLAAGDRSLHLEAGGPNVWLFVGVNGVGKTTSIGKVGKRQVGEGRSVIMAAGDTFRAAAAEQLGLWADRTNARLVRKDEGADPASVAYDGYLAAKATDADLLIIDTAGRLHNKRELMDELGKVKRVVEKQSGPMEETLLVLDATTGQNGIQQARAFMDAVDVTGLVLTKLDGSSKGGIAVAVHRELGLPVKLVGLGEEIDDLAVFDPDAFVDSLFEQL